MATPAQLSNPSLAPEPPDLAVLPGMWRVLFRAMGTTVSLLLPEESAPRGFMAVRSLFMTWEETLSRFRPESDLSTLNSQAGTPVSVSPLLFDVLATALEAAQATDGLYDPTLLPQIIDLGYDRSFEHLPKTVLHVPFAVRAGGDWRQIRLDPERRRVTLPPGVGVDLGGIAKGLAVDAALECLRDLGIMSALVNAGDDLAVLGQPPDGDAWSIAVPGSDCYWAIPLQLGALATSGWGRRHWLQGDSIRHHLLDPRTGMPAGTSLLSVTTVAACCAQAEVAAKVAFVLGTERGTEYLEAQGLPGLLVEDNGAWHATGYWPDSAMSQAWGEVQ